LYVLFVNKKLNACLTILELIIIYQNVYRINNQNKYLIMNLFKIIPILITYNKYLRIKILLQILEMKRLIKTQLIFKV